MYVYRNPRILNSDFTTDTTDRVRRSIIQRLEDLRRAGVTDWKRIDSAMAGARVESAVNPLAIAAPQAVDADSSIPDNPADPPAPRDQRQNRFGGSENSDAVRKKTEPVSSNMNRCATFQPLDLPLAERVEGLAALKLRVAECTRCQELATSRTQTVFGVGNPQAKIMFIGEAPGADEDKQGEPFVGKSGQLLNDIIKACRLRRDEIYICNVLRCRPPGNRLPAPDEAANCREFLDGQIAYVNPEYIVCWGACAAQNLLGVLDSIGKLRGRFFKYGTAKVACTYHPSYLIRNPAAKKDVWDDMKRLFLEMGIDLAAKPSQPQ